jgi:hypothetical protein
MRIRTQLSFTIMMLLYVNIKYTNASKNNINTATCKIMGSGLTAFNGSLLPVYNWKTVGITASYFAIGRSVVSKIIEGRETDFNG